jgi:HAD superfamily hydrolase (TIGR01509 family)
MGLSKLALDLVIFDCDGVLVDSEPIANRVFANQLRRVHVEMSVDEVMGRFVGKTRSGCLQLASELAGRPLPDDFGLAWDAELFEALNEVTPIEGVQDVLASLTIPYCVASNSIPERISLSLKAAGLLRRFEGHIFSASHVSRPKPAPDLFVHAARSMNAAPSRTVVIEDSITGVQAGLAAGMKVLAYTPDTEQQTSMREFGATPFSVMSEVAALLAQ